MKTISLCVHEDISHSVKWLLKEFDRNFRITAFPSFDSLESAFNTNEWDLLILDATALHGSIKESLAKIKIQKPGLKIILIISPLANKEEILAIIREKMVQGLVIKPFTGEVMSQYLEKVSNKNDQ
jgi:response regulator RpfG family c-di-GMP phosphodiesterase